MRKKVSMRKGGRVVCQEGGRTTIASIYDSYVTNALSANCMQYDEFTCY